MDGHGSLMRPLRTENLRPHPDAQAQYSVPDSAQTLPLPSARPFSAPLMSPLHSLDRRPQPSPPPCEPPKPVPFPVECGEPAPQADDSLESLLKSFLDEAPEEEPQTDEPDAIPTEQMPQPVFVPLFEVPSARRRRRPWLLLAALALLGGALWAALRAGMLDIIFP